MGITIDSKRFSCDMGYGGFKRFRDLVAEKVDADFYRHYIQIAEVKVMLLTGDKRKDFFDKYDAKTNEYVDKGIITQEVANFLYQSDCDGKVDRKQAKQIYKLIQDCDDNISFGYSGRKDCATMKDMKNIFSDGTSVRWS